MAHQRSRDPLEGVEHGNLLDRARVYLSGPMDFVASRKTEKQTGWRGYVKDFLQALGATVLDPWYKPEVKGLQGYGREGESTTHDLRNAWTFEPGREGAEARSQCSERFWPALHVDLRMVDTSDFVIAYCPTNIYSVGTPHEIILARQQRKPVLFVSPPVLFPTLEKLKKHLADDAKGRKLLKELMDEVPIRPNETGIPSAWYMPLIGGEHFFDGFGFTDYAERFAWSRTDLVEREEVVEPKKSLLPFLLALSKELPKKWDRHRKDFVPNDDWILWDLEPSGASGAEVRGDRSNAGDTPHDD